MCKILERTIMAKSIIEEVKESVKKKEKQMKQPKTIKVSTLLIGIGVFIALVAAFYCGTVVANNYKETVQAQALELSKKIDRK